jgi:pantoate--beta-alanine ligase
MEIFRGIEPLRHHLRDLKTREKSIALVPTMGALHEGHRACVDLARGLGDVLVVSIFVNPTQFGPREDLHNYPKPFDRDIDRCRQWGCDVVFGPGTDEMYESKQLAWVEVETLTEPLCGRSRPGHFRGVATVVAKLFNIVGPDVAVFGQKDAQQALVIRKMARQLDFPVDVRLAPTARDEDGLALSSRNAYLSPDERKRAPGVYRSLERARDLLIAGERNAQSIIRGVEKHLRESGVREIEYVELRDAGNLSPLEVVEGRVLLAVAVRLGPARLIDNVVLEVRGERVEETSLF